MAVTITETLAASKNNVGDSFSGVLSEPVTTADGATVFPRGARVAGEVVAAKGRGVDIAVILDRSDERGSHIGIAAMQSAGVPVWIDTPPGIAHMKAIVIDQRRVIAGSFNFTNSAQRRNVEDVLFVEDARLATRFLENWRERQAVSRAPLPDAFAGR